MSGAEVRVQRVAGRVTAWGRRAAVLAVVGVVVGAAAWAGVALAQDEIRYLRLGAGPIGEAHFPIGGMVANAISNPPGSRECERGGSCGVPGLIAVAQSTIGSVANVEALGDRRLEAALVQADVAAWAYRGTGPFQGRPVANLRTIALLHFDQMHLVARRDAHIRTVRDLRGKRVSLGETGSGTQVNARLVLQAFGLKEADVKAQTLRTAAGADALAAGRLDAFFVVDGAPVPVVSELAKTTAVDLVPIHGPDADHLRGQFTLMRPAEIPAALYQGQAQAVPTLEVGVLLLAAAELPPDLVYGISRALWHPSTQRLLAEALPHGGPIRPEPPTGSGIPLHPGAVRFYQETGLPLP